MGGNSIQQLMVMLGGDSTGLQSALTGADKTLKEFGLSFTKLTGAMSFSVVLADIVKVGVEFEEVSHTIERTTGATGAALDKLNGTVKALYSQTAQSANAVAQAVSQISIRTGATGVALEGLTKSALSFAKVTGTDLKASVDENQKLFAQWSIATRDQAEGLDMLLVASQKSGASVTALTETMMSMGPVMRGFGMSFEEALAFVGSFAKAGIDAADTMRGLNKVLERTGTAKEAHAALVALIDSMTQAKTRADALAIAFGAGFGRSAAVMVDALRNGTVNGKEFVAFLENAKGKTAEVATNTDTLGAAFTKLGHAMEDMVSGPGQVLVDFLKYILKVMTPQGTQSDTGQGIPDLSDFNVMAQGNKSGFGGFGGGFTGTTKPAVLNSLRTPSSGAGGGDGSAALAAYTEKLLAAEQALGVTFEKADKLKAALDLVTQAYHSGTVGIGVYAEALKSYNEALDRIDKSLPNFGDIQKLRDKNQGPKAPIESMDVGVAQFRDQPGSRNSVDDYLSQWGTDISTLIDDFDRLRRNTAIDQADLTQFAVKTTDQWNAVVDGTNSAFNRLKADGTLSAHDLSEAFLKMQQDVAEASMHLGTITGAQFQEQSKQIQASLAALNGTGKDAGLGAVGQQINGVFKSLGNVLSDAIFKTKDLGKAFEDLGRSIVKTILQDVTQMAIGKLLTSLSATGSMFATIGKAMSEPFAKLATVIATNAATAAAVGGTSRVGEVTGAAAVGAANAMASTAAIPLIGPALAPAAGAAMLASIMGFAPMASFAEGGDIMSTGPIFAHAGEHVINRDISDGLRAMMRNPSGGMIGGDTHVHLEGAQFSGGINRSMVEEVMNRAVKQARRGGATNL